MKFEKPAVSVPDQIELLKSNASNWPGLIVIKRGLPVPGAVWAQEYYEARHSWRWLPVHVPLTLLGRLNHKWAGWTRMREAMGHEIEVWAEHQITGFDPVIIRTREAQSLSAYPAFKDYRPDTISQEMRRCTFEAQDFVKDHLEEIRKHHA